MTVKTPPNAEIPVLQEPAESLVSGELLDELDIPILTTPAEPIESPQDS